MRAWWGGDVLRQKREDIMETPTAIEQLCYRLGTQLTCEYTSVPRKNGGYDLNTAYHCPQFPTLPRWLKPVWSQFKPRVINLAAPSAQMWVSKALRRMTAAEEEAGDGYAQLPLL